MSLLTRLRNGWKKKPAEAVANVPAVQNASTGMSLSQMTSWEDLIGGAGSRALSAERAMKHSAVYACVRIIAGTMAQLPLKTYTTKNEVSVEAPDHPAANLLRLRPNPEMSAIMFWRDVLARSVLKGNGYAWIERNRNGVILNFWRAHGEPFRMSNGSLAYQLYLDDGRYIVASPDDVLHIPGSMEWDGLRAKSALQVAAGAVNLGLDAEDFAARYFENDATPPGIITFDKLIDKSTVDRIREQWQKFSRPEKRHQVRVVPEGGKFEQLTMNAEDAQLLETRRFQIEDIARIYGVPPHMIGALDKTTSWGTGVEQMSIGFVQYTLGMHIVALEQELQIKVFGNSGYHAEVDVRALMRGDFKSRNDGYRQAMGGSAGSAYMTVNEIRKLENLPPVEGGDKLFVFSQGSANAQSQTSSAGGAEPGKGENDPGGNARR